MKPASPLDPSKEIEFVTALNWKLGLIAGFCFRRIDFPWMAVWEENCAREYAPWNGKTQARGMEFGTTPMPLGKEATFNQGQFLGAPCWCKVAAKGVRSAAYLAFLAPLPSGWKKVRDVRIDKEGVVLLGAGRRDRAIVRASGLEEFLS